MVTEMRIGRKIVLMLVMKLRNHSHWLLLIVIRTEIGMVTEMQFERHCGLRSATQTNLLMQ